MVLKSVQFSMFFTERNINFSLWIAMVFIALEDLSHFSVAAKNNNITLTALS